jgi:hypothetical protein
MGRKGMMKRTYILLVVTYVLVYFFPIASLGDYILIAGIMNFLLLLLLGMLVFDE